VRYIRYCKSVISVVKREENVAVLGAKGEVMAKIVSSSLVACVCVFLRKYNRDCERGQRKKKRGCKVAAPTIGIRALPIQGGDGGVTDSM
jgi:hypothetical protein